MRASETFGGLRVSAVAGAYVVMLGFDLPEADCAGLKGFAVHRTSHDENEAGFMTGMKVFRETDPGLPAGSKVSTRKHPIQSFQWADYSAKPGHRYTYAITALKGPPAALVEHASAAVTVTTESPENGAHDVYFNRGVAASQEYARRFGNRRPKDVPNEEAFKWLSRGLYEAMTAFVESCEAGRHALRICAYEFRYGPFLEVVKAAADRGVDVRIIYDARQDPPAGGNREAARDARIKSLCVERTEGAAISHNKFMVKLENGAPLSVWTGGTNFSEGGIFGHSNVAHVVEDPAIAKAFLDYFDLLEDDPDFAALRPEVESLSPLPSGKPPAGTTVVFSPRASLAALEWYADLARGAGDGLFMTFAFGINDLFQDVYRTSGAPFRMALLESKTRAMKKGPDRDAEEAKIDALRKMPENTFAIGSLVATNELDGWLKESLSNLNRNVSYVHNKFMLIDPLSDDPIAIAGSANFSDASTRKNDENMLVVRGDTRVADIYLGEFMRLYAHHAFRESLRWRAPGEAPRFLRTDDWWTDYYGGTPRSARRAFFARAF